MRRQATKILAATEYKANRDIIEQLLSDEDDNVALSAVDLVKNSGEPEFLDLLERTMRERSTRLQEAAEAARIEMLYLSDPNKAFSFLLIPEFQFPRCLKIL